MALVIAQHCACSCDVSMTACKVLNGYPVNMYVPSSLPHRELEHPNLCVYVGCVLDPTFSAIMMEHCSKGSLLEVLTLDTIQLGWAFRLTFAMDACRGLAYLHLKKIIHGRLSSTNCVIDNRWTLKLTGVPNMQGLVSLQCVHACISSS